MKRAISHTGWGMAAGIGILGALSVLWAIQGKLLEVGAALSLMALIVILGTLWEHLAGDSEEALDRYRAAELDLAYNAIAEYQAGIDYETPEFHRANNAAHAAAGEISWLNRWLIDRKVTRETDYWRKTGQR